MVTTKSRRRKLPRGIRLRRNADGSVSYDAQFQVKGYPRAFKAHPTLDEAIRWYTDTKAELVKQRKAGQVRPDIVTMSLADLNTEYLKDPETVALKDFADRERHLNWWSSKYGATKVLEFGVLQARAARDALIPGRANATVDRYLAAQRAAWNFGRAANLVPNDRAWPPKLMLSEPDARTRYLSDDELSALLKAAQAHSAVMYAAIMVALGTGVRRGELLRLTWADVDFEASTLTLLVTKTGKPRNVHMSSAAADALKVLKKADVVSTRHVFLYSDGTPFDGERLNREWCEIRKEAKLQDFRWHDLRHTAASYLAQGKSTLLEIMNQLGHKRTQTTAKYAHLIPGAALTGSEALDAKLRGAI